MSLKRPPLWSICSHSALASSTKPRDPPVNFCQFLFLSPHHKSEDKNQASLAILFIALGLMVILEPIWNLISIKTIQPTPRSLFIASLVFGSFALRTLFKR